MITPVFIIEIFVYSLVLWLGLYLIGRNPAMPRLWLSGLGLVAYALSLATGMMVTYPTASSLTLILIRIHWSLPFFPALFWFGAVVHLLPQSQTFRFQVNRWLKIVLLPATVSIFFLAAGTNLVFDFSSIPPQTGPVYFIFAGLILIPMLIAVGVAIRLFFPSELKIPLGLLLLVTLFFALSAGLLLLPTNFVSRTWLLLAVGFDFITLGLVIAVLDALDEGETLLPDFVRSFNFAAFSVLLFGGLVMMTIRSEAGLTLAMLTLLLTIIALILLFQIFWVPLQMLFDTMTFKTFPRLRQERADLTAVAQALPRANTTVNPVELKDDEFAKLTRRALSHMGNLPRLATNPLTRLPLIKARLTARSATDNTLDRAAELKSLLAESIDRLKPRDKGDFGTAEEWRYYNALYYPYVLGLKPYSRRAEQDYFDDAAAQDALQWFRIYVPERTLYNWQNAAAKLVAKDLREEMWVKGH